MRLIDLFDQLTYGELSQLSMGGVDELGIQIEHYPKIITHINLALTEVYKRFPLNSGEVEVQMVDGIQTYILSSDYAVTNTASTKPNKYIVDTEIEPFEDDVLRVEKVIDEEGKVLYLNDTQEAWSVFTPAYNKIQVPYSDSANTVFVTYRADHKKIPKDLTEEDIAAYEVDVPLSHLEPVLLYVAGRIHTAMSTVEGVNEGSVYMARFEASCNKITDLNLFNNDNTTNTKLITRGFV